MKKGQLSILLRKLRLIYITDWLRYYSQKFKNYKSNREFRKHNPGVNLPPDYLIYESFQLNYNKYYSDGFETAKWLTGLLNKYVELKGRKILDWGCGPGRLIRHLPEITGKSCEYFGTDYNKKSIDWCTENLPGISFQRNQLTASLPYQDNFFDIIYGISIFTHLSEKMHYDWYKELYRILIPGGIMLITTQGNNFKKKLTVSEVIKFENNKLIVRASIKEGHRTYSAFHPEGFMKKLFLNITVLEHTEPKPEEGKWLPQDIWIIKKS